ncbi:MAG: hypothetical protein K8I82_10775 [Anaerolineae bacterium]|nr:hypothetical protein [Anaerolineae bacterium]
MNGLEETYGAQVKFVQLNAFEEGQAAFKAGDFPGHPVMVIFTPDGQEVWRGFGVISEADLDSALQKALQDGT